MKQRVLALGFFDGVHLGHQALLGACRELANSLSCEAAAVTFDRHPLCNITGNAPALLNTPEDRITLLRRFGMAQVHTLEFNEALRDLHWRDFFRLLVEELGAAGLVCGDDYRFGKGGEGTADKLRTLCAETGIPCVVVPEQTVEGIRVSSSHIRNLIEQGDMEQAVRFLGHPHVLSGTVVAGRQLGRTIGVPTANLQLPRDIVQPRFGVYVCDAITEGKRYRAVTNVGIRPTVGGQHVTVEPWLLDFEGDLYGKTLTLEFVAFLRPEQKFENLEQLQHAILQDAETARHK